MKNWHYYNDVDPFVIEWVKELIKDGLVPDGEVDSRSIRDVTPDDVKGFVQCHFFCGILGWPLALQMAGVPTDTRLWTGSCPCQPFSAAGKRKGVNDERHLWPEFYRLIAECRPAIVFGEQVASKDGRLWLSGVRADLERARYAVGAADLCAASAGEEAKGRISYEDNSVKWERILVGAPHIRQRLYWMGVADSAGWDARRVAAEAARQRDPVITTGGDSWVANAHEGQRGRLADGEGREFDGQASGWQQGNGEPQSSSANSKVADSEHPEWRAEREAFGEAHRRNGPRGGGNDTGLEGRGLPRRGRAGECAVGEAGAIGGLGHAELFGSSPEWKFGGKKTQGWVLEPEGPSAYGRLADTMPARRPERWTSARDGSSPWSGSYIHCADGKARRIPQSVFQRMADGIPAGVDELRPEDSFPVTAEKIQNRVGLLRGFGNAIVPQLAVEFIKAAIGDKNA